MKRIEHKIETEHLTIAVVTFETDEADLKAKVFPLRFPDSYIMIGPKGGPLARVDLLESLLIRTLLDAVGSMPRNYAMVPHLPPVTGFPSCS